MLKDVEELGIIKIQSEGDTETVRTLNMYTKEVADAEDLFKSV